MKLFWTDEEVEEVAGWKAPCLVAPRTCPQSPILNDDESANDDNSYLLIKSSPPAMLSANSMARTSCHSLTNQFGDFVMRGSPPGMQHRINGFSALIYFSGDSFFHVDAFAYSAIPIMVEMRFAGYQSNVSPSSHGLVSR
jgi:hypothetical protein